MFSFLFSKKNPPLYFYNTLSRQKELFKPIQKNKVGMYTCGPTVYHFAHLGNMRTYIFEDILKRVLIANDYKVKHVMNITDVGHLTGDRDMGEDKIEQKAKAEGKTAWDIAQYYTDIFLRDEKLLNIISPNVLCKATDYIPEQIALIQTLEQKGFTYTTSDGVYFDTSKVSDYTKLSHQNIEALREGARVEKNEEKKNPTDFALWKFSPEEGEKRQMEWQSPWGIGFPGWHIECSAMALKHLGDHFDIHCSAIDHIDVHHTNEIAQTESATGKKPWVNVWMHGAFLNIEGGKRMAKSAGNFLTVENAVLEKKLSPLAYRLATFNVHYRKPMEWGDTIAESAQNSLDNLYGKIRALGNKQGTISKEWKEKFLTAINDDLNMPQAMAVLNEMLRSDLSQADKLATALYFDTVLGLGFDSIQENKTTDTVILSPEIQKIIADRDTARKNKDWQASDVLRLELEKLGYTVKDTSEGTKIEKL